MEKKKNHGGNGKTFHRFTKEKAQNVTHEIQMFVKVFLSKSHYYRDEK